MYNRPLVSREDTMTNPTFTNSDGSATKDGQQLTEWIVAQFAEADKANDLHRLNTLAGPVADYYVNVYKLHALTPERWLREYQNSFALNAWRSMKFVEELAAKVAQAAATATKADTVANELEALKAALAEAVNTLNTQAAEIKALKEAQVTITVDTGDDEPEVKTRKRGRKAADATEEPERKEGEPTADSEA